MKGTCVVCVIRNDTIWIGADSKVGQFELDVKTFCKIIESNDFVFTHSGLYIHGWKGTDVNKIFRKSASKGVDVYNTMNIFKNDMIRVLEGLGLYEILHNQFSIGDTINIIKVTALFATYNQGKAKRFTQIYSTIVIDTFNVKTIVKIDSTFAPKEGGFSYGVIGANAYIAGYIQRNEKEVRALPPIKLINTFIKIEAKNLPEIVGGPIDMIRITKEGISWIKVKEKCR